VWITLVKHELVRSRIACNVVIRDVITSIAFPAFTEREREREREKDTCIQVRDTREPVPCARKRGDTRATNTRVRRVARGSASGSNASHFTNEAPNCIIA